ncbi:Reverse transcriptase zinc-binding domain, partial [Arabidopsis suecica]
GSFWAVKGNSMSGSWIWRKMLKYRDMAKKFHRVEVKNGETTSFWYDSWSNMGCLIEKLGERGCIDLGIPLSSTVKEVMNMTRRRNHRQLTLNRVEEEIRELRLNQRVNEHDTALWKGKNDCYHRRFITRETWLQLRIAKPPMEGHKEIWFPTATPKYAFITWLVLKNRISTGERMLKWNGTVNSSCVFCDEPVETREHLFFCCPYSKTIWKNLAMGILSTRYSESWTDILKLLAENILDKKKSYMLRYVFQNSIHSIWSERNRRRHGEQPLPSELLVKMIDKNMRNRLSTLKGGCLKSAGGIQAWFESRQ